MTVRIRLMPVLCLISCGGGGSTSVPPDLGFDPALDRVESGPDPAGTDPGAGIEIPAPLVPCKGPFDCPGGWCVVTRDGPGCTTLCESDAECGTDRVCVEVASQPAPVLACVPAAPAVCAPCRDASDCPFLPGQAPLVCSPVGGYWFCLRTCDDLPCPDRFTCTGSEGSRICLPQGGTCECNSLGEGRPGRCDRANDAGTCSGTFTCIGGKVSACTAGVAVPEACNGRDDDCDGIVDPEDTPGCIPGFVDKDGDGFGAGPGKCLCAARPPYTASAAGDCDDADAGVHPGMLETCNGADDDCDGQTDTAGAVGCMIFFEDKDRDGYGSTTASACVCGPTGDFTALLSGDCDDDDPGRNPAAPEVCNGQDENCNGQIDEWVLRTFYRDEDGDGWGGNIAVQGCTPPEGTVAKAGDCTDFNPAIHPGSAETCNGVDDDCNGVTDDGLPLAVVYPDVDQDGYGGETSVPVARCLVDGDKAPAGFSRTHDDCDDSRPTVHPGAPEICDGLRNDCLLTAVGPDYSCPGICPGVWPVAIGTHLGQVAVAQLDSDAEWEVVALGSSKVRVLEHDGSVKWTHAVGGGIYSFPVLADLDHDGWLDVVVAGGAKIYVFRGSDGAVLATLDAPSSQIYYGAEVFDVDGDGWADVATMGSPSIDLVRLGAQFSVKESRSFSPLPGESPFHMAAALLADMDGDGRSELFAGSSSGKCTADPSPCTGRFFAFGIDGVLRNDPTWKDPNKPWFQVSPFPGSSAGEGRWPTFADVDHDGVPEILQNFFGAKAYVWRQDGTEHLMSGKIPFGDRPMLAPVEADGSLTSDGSLREVGGPVADIDGDGKWEVVKAVDGGVAVARGGVPMGGYPIPLQAVYPPIVADLNRDNSLEILFVGDNKAVNCYTLGPGTFALDRVLVPGGLSTAGLPGVYPTNARDPFEPNQPQGSPDPKTAIDPLTTFRAFPTHGLRDQDVAGLGWQYSLRALLEAKADADWYWVSHTWSKVGVRSVVADRLRVDLDVFVYLPDGAWWKYLCEAHVADTTAADLTIHPDHVAGDCPVGNKDPKGFLIRVKSHDPAKDFGPWPYLLTFNGP